MRAKKIEIEFDANELLRRMKGFAAGREPARERTVKLPPPVKPIPAKQIRAIRPGLGGTQTEFASAAQRAGGDGSRGKTARANRAAPPCSCWPWPGITRKLSMRRNGPGR